MGSGARATTSVEINAGLRRIENGAVSPNINLTAVFGVMLLKVAESLLISATGRLSSTVACLSERGGILG